MHITLTPELYEKLSARVQSSKEFASVDEYVNYILTQVVQQMEETSPAAPNNAAYTKDQEEAVKKRLEDLGYLD